MSGSMLAGTAQHRLESVETALAITAPEADSEAIASLVEQAERMCFVLDALQRPHAVGRSTSLNGVALV
jgi:organic hydroperoxide reductase OsmC/OhrA